MTRYIHADRPADVQQISKAVHVLLSLPAPARKTRKGVFFVCLWICLLVILEVKEGMGGGGGRCRHHLCRCETLSDSI